jgi:predicted N-formylglutamate amidohydrolase
MPFIFTCEHGGNRIPRQYQHLFKGQARILQSHRGWDPGALQLARACARDCSVPLHFSQVSRLLVDLNRSAHHRALFSGATRQLDTGEKRGICEQYYFPYRNRVETAIRDEPRRPVIHLAFHTFTPELNGVVRKGDIGLLYDPARAAEMAFCIGLQAVLKQAFPQLVVRRNYPYLGAADGFTTYLRKRFPQRVYLGIELEINQKHVRADNRHWRSLLKEFGHILRASTAAY